MTTIWDRKIAQDEVVTNCHGEHDYNARLLARSPLETPGTEAYFNAVLAAGRREAATQSRLLAEPAPPRARKAPKPKVLRLEPGKVFSGQRCTKCDRVILPGESLFAVADRPDVVCADCQPSAQWNRTSLRVVPLAEWAPRRKPSPYAPVLIPAVAV